VTDWRPVSDAAAARRRAALLGRARAYFEASGVLAVDTPALSPYLNTDPALDCLTVRTATGQTLFLQTSPEFFMKRLLASGYPDIYSIARVFRDGEAGRRHLPEFTLIEWYRLGFDLGAIIADAAALVAACVGRPGIAGSFVQVDFAAAFREYAGVDVFGASPDELANAAGADADLRAAVGDDRDAWLDLILDVRVAPCFDAGRITILRHFPASKAALARLCPADPRVADRFELFLGGLELANGYVELTDAAEQRRRIEAEAARRRRAGRPHGPADRQLLAALEAGLPSCAGVAVGAERLQMACDHAAGITDVVTFGFETADD
jgi:lysyl-tRNA synthetase class 2